MLGGLIPQEEWTDKDYAIKANFFTENEFSFPAPIVQLFHRPCTRGKSDDNVKSGKFHQFVIKRPVIIAGMILCIFIYMCMII